MREIRVRVASLLIPHSAFPIPHSLFPIAANLISRCAKSSPIRFRRFPIFAIAFSFGGRRLQMREIRVRVASLLIPHSAFRIPYSAFPIPNRCELNPSVCQVIAHPFPAFSHLRHRILFRRPEAPDAGDPRTRRLSAHSAFRIPYSAFPIPNRCELNPSVCQVIAHPFPAFSHLRHLILFRRPEAPDAGDPRTDDS